MSDITVNWIRNDRENHLKVFRKLKFKKRKKFSAFIFYYLMLNKKMKKL